MQKGHFTALAAALALAAFAPRLAAQDTSSAGHSRPDTSAYTGGTGADTSARPGQVGAVDTSGGMPADSTQVGRESPVTPSQAAPGLSGSDTSGVTGSADTSAKASDPTTEPSRRTSGTAQPGDSMH